MNKYCKLEFVYFDVSHWRNVRTQAGEHCDQRQHASDQQGNPTRYRIQAKPEAEPRQHNDQHGGRECLDEMMADLTLESKVDGEAGEVACIVGWYDF